MTLERLQPELHEALDAAAELAHERGRAIYLVGGAVRDRLLGRAIDDLDLVVEGDAIELGRALAQRLGVEARTHGAFGTATILLSDGRHLDVATARRESYAHPGALPEVEEGSLSEDLLRRDFTVNSLAIALEPAWADAVARLEVIDPTSGVEDLDDRLLRVHHARSFQDDATRVLRGVRFERRLGFRFDAATEALAREASAGEALAAVSAARLRSELEQLLIEDSSPSVGWGRLSELGLLAALGFAAPLGARLDEVAAAMDLSCRRAHGLLLAALAAEDSHARARVAARLELPSATLDELERYDVAHKRLRKEELEPHAITLLLEGLSHESLAVLRALGDQRTRSRLERFVGELRGLSLAIDGEMLVRRGFEQGPAIGRALEATRRARLDGRIGAEDELEFAIRFLENPS